MKIVIVCLAAALSAAAGAFEIPAGSIVHVRLTTPVSSISSQPGDRVEAIVISPRSPDRIVGTVCKVASAKTAQQAFLEIQFDGARLIEVDNARESVTEERITGIVASQSLTARIDQGLEKLAERNSDIGAVLQTLKGLLIRDVDPEIVYPAGVEMTLELTTSRPGEPPETERRPDAKLLSLVARQPLRTIAERPALPSDLTNLIFIGSGASVDAAFRSAGWTPAAKLTTESILETTRAIIESRGYQEAPVSTLLLDGRLPDLVFQKMNNTFAKRHHLRIWRARENVDGREVWIGAASHDIGMAFASDERTFYHTIHPEIDRERKKVMDDLMLTGQAEMLGLADRPSAPRETTNATGDRIVTDGRVAILRLSQRL